MRELMYVDSKDRIVVERQHKTKNPPGNASQRKKAIRSGWKPDWVTDEKRFVESLGPTSTEEAAVIYNENEHVAEMGRDLAAQTLQEIENWNTNFGSVVSVVPANCPCCGKPMENCLEEKATIYDYNHQEVN